MADLRREHTDDLREIARCGAVTHPTAASMAIELIAWRELYPETQFSREFAAALARAHEEAHRG